MPRHLAVWLTLLTAAAPALADAGAAQQTDQRLRTVIMGLQARRGVGDKQLAAALSDVLQGVYGGDPRRLVIGRDDISRVLDLEADKRALGCDTDKCLAEVGQALDAARIVTGSLDKLGDGFMVTMAEIDAKTLEPVARAQDRVKNDENELVETVSRLANELLKKSSVGAASRVFTDAGSVEIESDPRGARVVLAGNDLGVTPTRIDNLASGTQRVRLLRDDYEPIEVDVPVYPGGTTKVAAELRIMRALAEKNLEVRQAAWRDKNQWHTVGAWTKMGLGVGVAGVGTLLTAGSVTNGDRVGTVGWLAVTAAGGATVAWGILDLANPPPAPVAEWEMDRKVTVTPPSGKGEQAVHMLQEAPARR